MNRLGKALLILTAFAVALVMWWKFNYPTHAWKQKLTVTVTTPRGEVSGSSVVGVSWRKNLFSGGWGGALFHLTLQGEATAIDLGGGQFLFAILGYQRSEEPNDTGIIPLKLLRQRLPGESVDDYWSPDSFKRVLAARGRDPTVLPQKLYPRFLRFRDINDPTTAELVDPADLAKSFGPGVGLARVTIEITDDAVTWGIRKILPWLSRQVGWFPLNGADIPPIGPANLIDFDTLRK
ncbi:hypothetical protein [Xanthobacter sp.]|uniref:hypothetical protein n=1 Tax=Xanthobacter sp. TaxID=35809 RepID=UPI0035B1A2F4